MMKTAQTVEKDHGRHPDLERFKPGASLAGERLHSLDCSLSYFATASSFIATA
jgi:hypothetical protein